MDVNSGVANIDSKFVVDFKILKAAIAEQKSRTTIEKTFSPIFNKKEADRVILKKEDTSKKIFTAIATRRYLDRKNKSKSIKNIQLSNPNSRTSRAIKANVLDLVNIPPQVKYMTTQQFTVNESIDPLVVQETATVIEETQANVYVMVKLSGFERDSENKINLSAPIYEKVTEEDLTLGGILVKAVEYENPELGIVKDNYSGTIYDNLTYIRRRDGVWELFW